MTIKKSGATTSNGEHLEYGKPPRRNEKLSQQSQNPKEGAHIKKNKRNTG